MLGYTTVFAMLERVNRIQFKGELPANEEEIVEWISQALAEIGAHGAKEILATELEVFDGKAKLPSGVSELYNVLEAELNIPMDDIGYENFKPYSYRVHNGYIFTDFMTGSLFVRYLGIPEDENGYPLIPSSEYVLAAVEAYILERRMARRYAQGHIGLNEYNYHKEAYVHRLRSAREDARALSPDKIAVISKLMQRPIVDVRRPYHGRRR